MLPHSQSVGRRREYGLAGTIDTSNKTSVYIRPYNTVICETMAEGVTVLCIRQSLFIEKSKPVTHNLHTIDL